MRRRRPRDPLGPQQPWPVRTITLIADQHDTSRICEDWSAAGWQVLTVDVGEPSLTGHPTHVVRVAVPPGGVSGQEPALAPPDGDGEWQPRVLAGGERDRDERRDHAGRG